MQKKKRKSQRQTKLNEFRVFQKSAWVLYWMMNVLQFDFIGMFIFILKRHISINQTFTIRVVFYHEPVSWTLESPLVCI